MPHTTCHGWHAGTGRFGYGGYPCERPAVDGEQFCGRHLAGQRRKEAAEQTRFARQDAASARRRRIDDAYRAWRAAAAACPHCSPALAAYDAARSTKE